MDPLSTDFQKLHSQASSEYQLSRPRIPKWDSSWPEYLGFYLISSYGHELDLESRAGGCTIDGNANTHGESSHTEDFVRIGSIISLDTISQILSSHAYGIFLLQVLCEVRSWANGRPRLAVALFEWTMQLSPWEQDATAKYAH